MISVAFLMASATATNGFDRAVVRNGRGWATEARADSCVISQRYEGDGQPFIAFTTSFDVPQKVSVLMALHNDNWSLKSGELLRDVTIEFEGFRHTPGVVKTGSRGFFIIMDLEDYASLSLHDTILRVFKAGKLIESMSISGLSSSGTEFQSCLSTQQRQLDADAHEERLQQLPKDPFGK